MIKADRHSRNFPMVRECDGLEIPELARRLGCVSAATVRRDVVALAAKGLVRRMHGIVARSGTPAEVVEPARPDPRPTGGVDVLLLPPVEGREADTLRGMARRRVPLPAESSEQEGGTNFGSDDFAVARALNERPPVARILPVSLKRLPDTRASFATGKNLPADGGVAVRDE